MSINPFTLVLTIIGGLIVAGILGWIRKPRLCVLVPRMFSYSQITDRGQLVEMTIFNRGFKTEELIELTLNPALKYELLGSSSQDVSLFKNKLTVSRIGASDEVAAILVVENGIFKNDDINQCLSKDTKGTIAPKLELVPITASQRIGLITWAVLIPALLYGVTYGFDYYFNNIKKEVKDLKIELNNLSKSEAKIVNVQDWKIKKIYTENNNLFNELVNKKLAITTDIARSKRDVVKIEFAFENKTNDVIEVRSFSATTSKSEDKIPSYDRVIHNLMLFPNKKTLRNINVIVPNNTKDITEKTVFIEAFLTDADGETLSMRKDFIVD